jgi:uncharacterized protein (DUF1684 family)
MNSPAPTGLTVLELSDWRRRVAALYEVVRATEDPRAAWMLWRAGKEKLYREHPQSPVREESRSTHVFHCFPYDAALRVTATLVDVEPRHIAGDDVVPGMTQVGVLRFAIDDDAQELAAYWLDGYAGGLFVPFADATSGSETYGGGRYILDTAKGADLGGSAEGIVLDFNFAYMPSCAHDPQWRCPLARPENRLAIAVRAGEQLA